MTNSNGFIQNERIAALVMKHLQDNLTVPETEELERWKNESAANSELFATLTHPDTIRQEVQRLDAANNAIRQKLAAAGIHITDAPATVKPPARLRTITRWVAAACLVLAAGTAALLWRKQPAPAKPEAKAVAPLSVPPGKNGAVLTLADGSTLVLDSMGNGEITTQTGAKLILKDSALAYTPAGGAANGAIGYNTMTTPNGRQFQVTLPDGSKVWLNAASSLRYPTAFTGKERLVEVTGEAWFEVAPKANMPFRINVNNQATIEVLGTSFNVNAYENEGMVRATLINGAIAVSNQQQRAVLKPGQQASVAPTAGSRMRVELADVDKVAAWRYGLFNFQDASLQEVMKQLERWYDIRVVYDKKIPDIKFGGELSRNMTLEGLLRTLEASEVHFRMEDARTLVISQ
ncbi:ferric-dicitrate binding protein FerR (iron transport regulator) [Filimonas zeae]|uniref:FecR family protein n=1 Tax=Filimonas zeae TaxID=1737353 RepID=A0A917IMF1_9BACT|nr:FecR family protein [Filimonas zeae]MDR6337112.1 ferric-dicitrate binding protein FerR (iron transport regulator) [Filimonas zeae]GGH57061.1 hypothetical protein GCM10011379_01320 [Filimonas zeae]